MGYIRYRKDRPKHWLAGFRAPDGTEVSKAFGRKIDAQRWLTTQQSDQLRGQWSDPRSSRISFEDQATEWMANRRSQRRTTLARDKSLLQTMVLPTFGRMPLWSIDVNRVEKWLEELIDEGYAPATIHKAFQILGGVLRAAVRAKRLGNDVTVGVSLPQLERHERRFLTAEEILALAKVIDPRYRLMVLLGGFGGLRFGEVAALRASSLGPRARTVTVRETVTHVSGELETGPPKTRASIRTVALPNFVADELVEHAKSLRNTELLFTAPNGGIISPNNWRGRVWNPAVEALGLDGVTFHALRHSQGALLVEQGEHPLVIARRLGHTSVKTVLDVYGHLFDGIDQEAANRLDQRVFDSGADQMRARPNP
jgi:integrase